MRTITKEIVEKFRNYLSAEEKAMATLEKYIRDVRAFSAWLGGKCVDKQEILNYKEELCEKYSVASVNSVISALNTFFAFCDWNELRIKAIKMQRQIFASKEKELTKQIALGQEELHYLKSVLEELNRAQTDGELEEIRQELQAGGYLKADTGKRKMKQTKSAPMRFVSTDGFSIYVGRNNRQNEELTFRSARKDDLWLHAQKVHGSHVIIACAGAAVPDDTVTQAAQLAAHYAETAGGQNIAVDVTPVRQVKKIPSGKPGMVIYHTYRTVIVNPYPDIVVDALNAEKKEP